MAFGEKLNSNEELERVDEKNYRSPIGCLLYLTATRSDVIYVVSLLSRFVHCCNISHFKAAERVLRYIKGTANLGEWFKKAEALKLIDYTDNDWVGSVDDMRSTSGYIFSLRLKQKIVTQSSTKLEYVAVEQRLTKQFG